MELVFEHLSSRNLKLNANLNQLVGFSKTPENVEEEANDEDEVTKEDVEAENSNPENVEFY